MERTTIAVALALVVAGLGVGIAPAPGAALSQTVCDEDNFDIPDQEPTVSRPLSAGASEVGTVVVNANQSEDLVVDLDSDGLDGELHWIVKYDDGQSCVPLDTDDCEAFMNDPGREECRLDAPSSGERTYHVLFEEIKDNNSILYSTWID